MHNSITQLNNQTTQKINSMFCLVLQHLARKESGFFYSSKEPTQSTKVDKQMVSVPQPPPTPRSVWNSLADYLFDPAFELNSFRRQLKTFLFAQR